MKSKNFLSVKTTHEANEVNLGMYRIIRFSKSRDTWLFVKRATTIEWKKDEKSPNFVEHMNMDNANEMNLSVYRFETFSETRSAWMFVKRRIK